MFDGHNNQWEHNVAITINTAYPAQAGNIAYLIQHASYRSSPIARPGQCHFPFYLIFFCQKIEFILG